MTIYNHLPVYKASYDLLLEIFRLTKEFSREYKYTIGEELKKETIKIIVGIYRANSKPEKTESIREARENLEVVRLLVRLTKDLKQINIKKFVYVSEKIETLSRQLTGWQKSQK